MSAAPVDTTRNVEERVMLLAGRERMHLAFGGATACGIPFWKCGQREYGSVAALSCSRCRRAFEKERRG